MSCILHVIIATWSISKHMWNIVFTLVYADRVNFHCDVLYLNGLPFLVYYSATYFVQTVKLNNMYLQKMCFILCFLGFFNRLSQRMWSQIKSTVQLSGTIVGESHAWSSILQTTIFFYLVIRSKISLQYSSKVWLWIEFSVARSHNLWRLMLYYFVFQKGQLGIWDFGKVHEKTIYGNIHNCILNNIKWVFISLVVAFFDMFAFRFHLHYYVLSQ